MCWCAINKLLTCYNVLQQNYIIEQFSVIVFEFTGRLRSADFSFSFCKESNISQSLLWCWLLFHAKWTFIPWAGNSVYKMLYDKLTVLITDCL